MASGKHISRLAELECRLWEAADQLWANSSLSPSEYLPPVLGLIFPRFTDNAFTHAVVGLTSTPNCRRTISKMDYRVREVPYLPIGSRFSQLVELPESTDLGKRLNEIENEDLRDVLSKAEQQIRKFRERKAKSGGITEQRTDRHQIYTLLNDIREKLDTSVLTDSLTREPAAWK